MKTDSQSDISTGESFGKRIALNTVFVTVAASLLALSAPVYQSALATPQSSSISLDEPFTGASLVDPTKWISMRGGSHPEWPCLTAASTSISASVGTIEACVNQGGSTVAAGEGAMRLSRYRLPAQNWTSAGSLLYTDALGASEGIDISFSIRMADGNVADGMSFFLKDGANANNTVGVAGGALGYGRFTTGTGVPGALLGVGFDKFGNFSSEQVASDGCASRGTHPNTTPRNPQDKNMLVLRGPDTSATTPQNGSSGYCYLQGQAVTFSSTEFQRVRVKVDSYTPGSPTVVNVYLAADSSPSLLPLTPTLTQTMTLTATTFKFGFSASTGYWSNDHEIRGLRIRPSGPTVTSLATAASTGSGTGPTSGGTTLTIAGTNIDPAATVAVDGQACTNIAVSGDGTQLNCTTPASTLGTKQVVITNPNGGPGFGTFTYVNPTPTVATVSPSSGTPNGGNTVTVVGTGFVDGATVTLGGQPCTNVVVQSSTSLQCVAPPGTDGVVDVIVTNVGDVSGTGGGLYTYATSPATEPESTTSTSVPSVTVSEVPSSTTSATSTPSSTSTTSIPESPVADSGAGISSSLVTSDALPQTGAAVTQIAMLAISLLGLVALMSIARRRWPTAR